MFTTSTFPIILAEFNLQVKDKPKNFTSIKKKNYIFPIVLIAHFPNSSLVYLIVLFQGRKLKFQECEHLSEELQRELMRGLLKSETKTRAKLKMDCSSPRRPWDKRPTLSLKCTMHTAGSVERLLYSVLIKYCLMVTSLSKL